MDTVLDSEMHHVCHAVLLNIMHATFTLCNGSELIGIFNTQDTLVIFTVSLKILFFL